MALNTVASGDRFPQRPFILPPGAPGIPLDPIRGGTGRRTMQALVVCLLHSLRVEDVRMQINLMYPGLAAAGQVRAVLAPIVFQSFAG